MRQSVYGAFFLVAALLLAPIPAAAQSQFPEWDVYMNYWYQSSPATGAGDISMAVGADGNLYVFDADGNKIGEYPTGGTGGSSPVIGDDGSTYIAGETAEGNGTLNSLDQECNPQWTSETAPITTDLAVDYEGKIVFGTADNQLVCMGPDGKEKWSCDLAKDNYQITSSPTSSSGLVYIGVWDSAKSEGVILKIDGPTNFQIPLAFSNNPFVGNISVGNYGNFSATTANGDLFIKMQSGDSVWYKNKPGGSSSPAAGENGFRPRASNVAAPVSSPSIDVDGTIYFGREDGTFHAVNPDGTGKWVYTAGGPIKSSPAIGADGTIYFGCNDGYLYLLRRDGTLVVKVQYGGAIECSPTLTKSGQLYFGTADGYLHSVPVMAGLADSPWPMYRQNPRHTGSVPWIPKPIPFLPLLLLE
jgi:outer membrane protein assembly factor BamB